MTVDFESATNDVVFGDKFGDFFRLKNMTETEILFGHLAAVSSALMSNKRSLLVSADRDEKIRIAQFPKYWNISSFLFGHKRYISCLSFFNAHQTEVVSAGADGLIVLWDISDPEAPKEMWSVQLPEGPINSIAVTGEGEVYVLRAYEPAILTRITDGRIANTIQLHVDAQTVFTGPKGRIGLVDTKSHIRFLDEESVRLSKDVDGVPISLMKFVHHENVESGEFEDRKRPKISE
jgi:WD40 repeat protein